MTSTANPLGGAYLLIQKAQTDLRRAEQRMASAPDLGMVILLKRTTIPAMARTVVRRELNALDRKAEERAKAIVKDTLGSLEKLEGDTQSLAIGRAQQQFMLLRGHFPRLSGQADRHLHALRHKAMGEHPANDESADADSETHPRESQQDIAQRSAKRNLQFLFCINSLLKINCHSTDSAIQGAPMPTEEISLAAANEPQNVREAAIQNAISYYAPQPGDTRTAAERREMALESQIAAIEQAGSAMQESVMRALMVTSLLDQGLIERLPADPAPEAPESLIDESATAARHAYVAAIANDARLASRLMKRAAPAFPADPGESMQDHFNRVAGADFALGFSDCEYPQLHEQCVTEANAQHDAAQSRRLQDSDHEEDGVLFDDSQSLVDEDRVRRENMHLIRQALCLRMDSEAQVLGLQARAASAADSIDLAALVLSDVDFQAISAGAESAEIDTSDVYPRER